MALPWAVFVSNILVVVLLASIIFRQTWGRELVVWAGKHVVVLGLVVSGAAFLGSIFYSEVIGFEPCSLCWWQRVALFPIFIMFLSAVKGRDRSVFKYVLPLSIIGGVIAVYHSFAQWDSSRTLCSGGVSCSKLYVFALGYVTIPTMAASIAALLILLWWANKIYVKENSNS